VLWVIASVRRHCDLARPAADHVPIVDRLLHYILIFPLGVQRLWALLCRVFIPDEAASAIGWESSPIQYEVASPISAAVAVMATCLLGGAGIGHIRDIALGDNLPPAMPVPSSTRSVVKRFSN
jgi:hypothetical protein